MHFCVRTCILNLTSSALAIYKNKILIGKKATTKKYRMMEKTRPENGFPDPSETHRNRANG